MQHSSQAQASQQQQNQNWTGDQTQQETQAPSTTTDTTTTPDYTTGDTTTTPDYTTGERQQHQITAQVMLPLLRITAQAIQRQHRIIQQVIPPEVQRQTALHHRLLTIPEMFHSQMQAVLILSDRAL